MSVRARLDRLPCASLGHLPTPLQRLNRLEQFLGGPELWVKRDDCTGLGLGGNKVRKLEYLCGDALAQGASTLITYGAVQSNHARQTAAAAARLGLGCELMLSRLVPRRSQEYECSGNIFLDRILGARTHVFDHPEQAEAEAADLIRRIEAGGERCYEIPPGGSSVVGSLGYVRAGLELATQLSEAGVSPTRVVTAAATLGTMAGLATGLHAAGVEAEVIGVPVYRPGAERTAVLTGLIDGLADLLGAEPPRSWRFEDGYIGEGYGLPTPQMREAVELCARTEGLVLDPVYTGKAMAGLIGLIRSGHIGSGETVVFVHTGGTPGLFAYRDTFE
ncbi:MAG: L-cysteate sulfo-lyase [Acidimicrobiales bacterium]|nr:MAG: D-cysteine desulfhydrase family protein [Actinomycetota bacterium]MBV6508829.1 L-cysteate sulfo-lyase [Acidimicrobiales bacterium]RIK04958.1 MAG: D-cysteine desulfhydrase [Acidobacteriota bacterium]